MKTLLHTSNIYFTEPQAKLAEQLVNRWGGGARVFFGNSGAEANECAIKLARRFGHNTPSGGQGRYEIIVFESAFHGRTFGSLSATPNPKYQGGFGPLVPGFKVARFGDIASVKHLVTPLTCAVMIEPIQGEGGIRTAPPSFFQELSDLCKSNRLLLIFDEVQTGMGRTGTFFAHQNPAIVPPSVKPDAATLAKGLANGLPIGAAVARTDIADLLHPGDHASTFGGGAVPCTAALTVLKALTPAAMKRVAAIGKKLSAEFSAWKKEIPSVKDVRGAGCMWGLELDRPAADVVKACREKGLLVNGTADRVVRLLPPFCLTDAQIKSGLKILKNSL